MNNFKNKKIAIYGGTFNPIHIGHLLTGFDLIEKLKYDYVIYIPTNIPAHKKLFNDLYSWKEIDLLSKTSDMICMFRNNSKKINSKYKIKWLENRIINISSTEIRDRIKNKLSINFLVTDKVNKYILKNKLYRDYL